MFENVPMFDDEYLQDQEPFAQRMNQTQTIEYILDQVISEVHKRYPSNETARLRIYKSVAESLLGLVSSFQPTEVNHG